MLKGLAEDYYYNSNLADKSFKDIYIYIWNFFKGPEYYWKNLTEWNSISLQGVINSNIDKGIY